MNYNIIKIKVLDEEKIFYMTNDWKNQWRSYKPYYEENYGKNNIYIGFVSIDKLINDNNLNNKESFTNHEKVWGNKPSNFKYNEKLDNGGFIYAKLFNDKYIIGDGRHRIVSLKNSGYTTIQIPIIIIK